MYLLNSKNIGRVNFCFKVKALQKALFDDAKFRPNTKGIIDAIDAGLKTQKAGGRIVISVGGKVHSSVCGKKF